jgi:hypothetical protein
VTQNCFNIKLFVFQESMSIGLFSCLARHLGHRDISGRASQYNKFCLANEDKVVS